MLKTSAITIVIAAIVVVAFQSFHPSEPSKPVPAHEPFSQTLDNKFFRKIYARDELKKVARDPDSVVVEDVSDVTRFKLKNAGEALGFLVTYRAKNGFGGYERETKWIFCDLSGNNVRFMNKLTQGP
jgi:hypothetical protein